MSKPRELRQTLSLLDGVALAIGSIAGSGILFLPSLTYAVAGPAVLLVWLGGTLLCLPMMFMFASMMRLVPDGSGIEGFVERGLGARVAATVPILFLALVLFGMPGAALVAGSYVADVTGGGTAVRVGGALALLGVAIAFNLAGTKVGARTQRTITWVLVGMIALLCFAAFPAARGHYHVVSPQLVAPGRMLSGVVLAFWAFAGFENLTFIAGEFRNPRRDFPLAMVISFLLYGSLAIILTATLAALVPRDKVSAAGLLQLAHHIHPVWLASGIIGLLAVAIVQVAAVSWIWGISRLIYRSSRTGRLPHWFSSLSDRAIPERAIAALGTVFLIATLAVGLSPAFFMPAITIASSVFLFLYVLCVVSYLRIEQAVLRRMVYAGFLVFLIGVLVSVGVKALYPVVIFVLTLVVSAMRDWNRTRRSAPHPQQKVFPLEGQEASANGNRIALYITERSSVCALPCNVDPRSREGQQ